MAPTDRLDWRTSSRTGAGENCVEVCLVPPGDDTRECLRTNTKPID